MHAVPDQAPTARSATRAARDPVPIVGALTHAAPDQGRIDRSATRAVRDRVPIVGALIHAVPDQRRIDRSATRAARDPVLIVHAPIRAAPHRAVTARAVILAAAIPARRGLHPDPGGRLLAVDVQSLARGANLAPIALELIAPSHLAAVRPLILVLQRRGRNPRSLILTSGSSMLQSGNPMSPIPLLGNPIHMSMSLTPLEKGRILTSKCRRLVARNPARVEPGPLLAVAVPHVARMLKASAFKRSYRAQGSRRAARLRTGFARAASPSTVNLPCSAHACLPPTNCASTVASFANARRVAAPRHSLSTVRPAKV